MPVRVSRRTYFSASGSSIGGRPPNGPKEGLWSTLGGAPLLGGCCIGSACYSDRERRIRLGKGGADKRIGRASAIEMHRAGVTERVAAGDQARPRGSSVEPRMEQPVVPAHFVGNESEYCAGRSSQSTLLLMKCALR